MTEQYGRLDGKIAIVTGGTQGLGATIANLFAERGAKGVVICGRNVAKGEAKAEQIRKATGAQVLYVEADLEKVEDARKVVSACDATFGRVDALVNAAAITDRGTILDTSPELFDRMFAVNVRAPFFLMQEAVKLMRREGTQGTIVNIGSMSAMAGQPFIAAYCSSKGALETLTKNTAYARAAQPHSRQWPQYRLDGVRRRRPHPARISWGGQTTGSKRRPPANPSAGLSTPSRSRACLRLSLVGMSPA